MCLGLSAIVSDGIAQENAANQQTGNKEKTAVASDAKLYWIFLTTGKSTKDEKPESIEEMQKAHLENFKSLAEEEKLITAGPMKDPDERLRGIVVVKAKNRAELTSFFEDDPYVQEGFLKIEATEMKFNHGAINTKITPQGLEEFRLVIFEKGEAGEMKQDQLDQNENYLNELSAEKDLRLTVMLPKGEFNRTALMILTKPNEEKQIEERLREIPAVKSGFWKSKVFPLYMGKGSLSANG